MAITKEYLDSIRFEIAKQKYYNAGKVDAKLDELKQEVDVLAGRIGHKRLIAVYGEHPTTSTEYIAETIETCSDMSVRTQGSRQSARSFS